MKKTIGSFAIISSLFASAVFANNQNTCINNISSHTFREYLTLDNCNIRDEDMDQVVNYLSQHTEINTLQLANNQITSIGTEKLSHNKTLKMIILQNNNIDAFGAQALSKMKNVKGLNLDHNQIGDAGAYYLAKAKQFSYLLSLCANNISTKGILALLNNEANQFLEIGENKIDLTVLHAIAANKNLGFIGLKNSNIGDEGAAIIGMNNSLKGINVAGNNLTAAGLLAITANKNLLYINAGNNHFGDSGVDVLINNSPQLEYLELANVNLSDVGASKILSLNNLKFISLDNNQIGDNGAVQIASLQKLLYVSLGNNHISDKGIASFSDHPELSYLFLNDNDIHDKGAMILANRPGHIMILNLKHNLISEAGRLALAKSGIPVVISDENNSMLQTIIAYKLLNLSMMIKE